MKQIESQKQAILEWLKKGRALNSFQAIKLFGCTKLSTRIGELEREGKISVVRTWFPVQTRFCAKVMVRRYQKVKP